MKSRMFLTIAIGVGLSACDSKKPAEREGSAVVGIIHSMAARTTRCPEEANYAVLNKLFPVIGRNEPHSVGEFDRLDAQIACIREWSKSIKDDCARTNYERWLDFYADRSKENRASMLKGEPSSSEEKYEAKRREENRRLAEYEREHPVQPPPPACSRDLIQAVKP